MDTFICGACQETFHDINIFITHKNECAVKDVNDATNQEVQTVQHIIHVQLPDGQVEQIEGSSVTVIEQDGGGQVNETIVNEDRTSERPMCLVEVNEGDPASGVASEIHLVDYEKVQELTRGGATTITTQNGDVRVIVAESPSSPVKPPRRKPGRPKKSQESMKPKEPVVKKPVRPELPEKGEDGKYHCKRCKKAFGRERHFNTHRCLATTDYVDIMQEKELLSGDESEEEDEKYADKSYDFKIGSRPRGRPPKNRKLIPIQQKSEAQESIEPSLIQNVGNDQTTPEEGIQQQNRAATLLETSATSDHINSTIDPNIMLMSASKDSIPNIPVFASEEEKLAFEETLNVDLSRVDNMYKTHIIDQNVNEHAPPPASRTQSELSVYSCNTCDKVFKTVSHMRLHCLTHTDIKPFKCSRCNFASNSKGNLYTHMRIHTGQFYSCTVCSFHTPNKTHLVEHMATHSKIRQKCAMCKKDYNTVKSLVNHIRKYHPNKSGKEYLEKFQGKQNQGTAVLHQCHVCLRKFKKKIDRDRHLFVHNIKGIPNMHECDLCEYTATRRSYLEQHFTKHRVVYNCVLCSSKFPSSVRLNQHLGVNHKITDSTDNWVDVFQQCISSSLYLPEPDGSTDNLFETGEETQQAAETLGDAGPSKEQDYNKMVVIEPVEENYDVNTAVSAHVEGGKDPLAESSSAEKNAENASDPQVHDIEAIKGATEGDLMDDEAEMSEEALALENATDYDIYKRLNYVPMTMEVFHKLRMTFGTEECEFCGRLFYSKSDFTVHVRTHTGERPFTCGQCSYRASTKDSLKRHTEKEHDKVTYVCQQCEYIASSRTQLWHHQQKHREPQEVECTLCSLKYPSAKRLRTHLSVQHPNLEKVEVRKMLSACQKTQGRLGRRSHKCPFCAKTFMRGSADLQKHIWIHQGIKPFKCNLCPHACRSKNNLMSHMLRHSADKPFLCTECNKAYKSRTALRWHIRTHKEGKIFRCVKCNYEAVQYSHLKRHMQTHDIVKRFVCQHCNYSANTLGYMKIHYTRHHKGQEYTHNPVPAPQMAPGTKVYRCLSCDYLFGNLSDIKRHLKVRHHVSVEDIHALENIESNQQQPQGLQQVHQLDQIQNMEQVHQVPQISHVQHTDHVQQVQQTVEVPVVMDDDGEHVPPSQSEVQVEMMDQVHLPATSEEQDASSALQALQYSVPQSGMDEQTASAVNILQHIIGMSKQGAFGSNQQITVQSDDGQSFIVNPDTIIVQQDSEDQELVISGDGQDGCQQYVIQYVTQNQGQDDVISEIPEVGSQVMEIDAPEVQSTEIVTEQRNFTGNKMENMEIVELETPVMNTPYEDAHDVRIVIPNDADDVSGGMPIETTEVIEHIYTTVEEEATIQDETISTEIIAHQP